MTLMAEIALHAISSMALYNIPDEVPKQPEQAPMLPPPTVGEGVRVGVGVVVTARHAQVAGEHTLFTVSMYWLHTVSEALHGPAQRRQHTV